MERNSVAATVEETANILKLLGDNTRLTIIGTLSIRECCVCELVELVDMSQPAVSQHLRKLRDAGLVMEKRKGHWMFYSVRKDIEMYPLIEKILAHIPDQKGKLDDLDGKGKRVNCT